MLRILYIYIYSCLFEVNRWKKLQFQIYNFFLLVQFYSFLVLVMIVVRRTPNRLLSFMHTHKHTHKQNFYIFFHYQWRIDKKNSNFKRSVKSCVSISNEENFWPDKMDINYLNLDNKRWRLQSTSYCILCMNFWMNKHSTHPPTCLYLFVYSNYYYYSLSSSFLFMFVL